jgi:metal-dependent amidase/aminoacylase/carboxypeptidase family protein
LTLRSYSNEVREHTITAIRRIVRGLAKRLDCRKTGTPW